MCIRDRDLVRAFADLKQLRVAHKALQVVLLAVAVAAQDLLALQADLGAAGGREELRLRGLQGVTLARDLHAGRVVREQLHLSLIHI